MKYNKEEVRTLLQEPNGAQSLVHRMNEVFEAVWELWTEGNPAAAGLLAQAARNKTVAGQINGRLGHREQLYAAFEADNFKMRKNAARLAGALGRTEDAGPLIRALSREETRMVRPSQILALGALPCREAEEFLRQYQPELPQDPSQEPHYRQEADALKKARGSFAVLEKHRFAGFPSETRVELRCPAGLSEVLGQEADKAGLTVEKVRKTGVRARVWKQEDLMRIRGWHEILIPVAAEFVYDVKKIASLCRERVLPFLKAVHEGEPPFQYRWELRGFQRRKEVAQELVSSVDSEELDSNPSAYEVELRLTIRGDRCRLDMKLYTMEDTRFLYRKKALPASIHPATAAGVIRVAAPWLKEGARVADPCCGSGTLLIERNRFGRCELITGIDISRTAVEAAKENFRAAGVPGRFKVTDCIRWNPTERYDEIFSNLPFGHRVGTHEGNIQLYRQLVKKMPDWLQSGGIAVLYTMELQLLLRCLEEEPRLELLQMLRTEAGGLTPGIFILQNKK